MDELDKIRCEREYQIAKAKKEKEELASLLKKDSSMLPIPPALLDETDLDILGLITQKDLNEAVTRLEHIFKLHDRRINDLDRRITKVNSWYESVNKFVMSQADELETRTSDLETRITELAKTIPQNPYKTTFKTGE